MKVSLKGKLVDCVNNKSKDGQKQYYSLNIYSEGQMYRVGVPEDIFFNFQEHLDQDVSLQDISLWVDGKYSLYIKE